MRRCAFQIGTIVGTLCILSTPALAQSFGQAGVNRGGGSAFGGGTGGGFGGGGTGGSGGFGAGGFGGGSFGSGGFGGFGGQGATGGGIGGSAVGGAAGVSGFATQGQNQFMIGNQAMGGFVGRGAGDMQQFIGAAMGNQFGNQAGNQNLQRFQNQARRQQFQQFQNQANNAMGGRGGRGGRGDQVAPIRVSLRVGFTPPPQVAAGLSDRLQTQVSRTLSSRVGVTNPTVAQTGQTVTLRGTVASEEQKLLAEEILSLQPGVSTVVNELAVVPPLPPPAAN